MKQPADDQMTPRRASVLYRLVKGSLRLGDVDVKVRRALISCGRATRKHVSGEGWRIEITDAGRQALAEWDERKEAKERTWRTP